MNAPTGNQLVPEGQTLIRFDTAGQLDFANVSYLIVLNTSGNDQQPTAQGFNSDFKNWSYYFIVGGAAGVASSPPLYQIYQDPVNGGSKSFNLNYPQNAVNFQTPCSCLRVTCLSSVATGVALVSALATVPLSLRLTLMLA